MSVDGEPEVEIFDGQLDKRAATYLNDRVPVGFAEKVAIRIYEDDPVVNDPFGVEYLAYVDGQDGERQVTDFIATDFLPNGHYTLSWRARQ
jgi:hypothetical protein